MRLDPFRSVCLRTPIPADRLHALGGGAMHADVVGSTMVRARRDWFSARKFAVHPSIMRYNINNYHLWFAILVQP